jgi:hypothetical protein
MFRKNLAFKIAVRILIIVSITIPIQNLGWAAPIKCGSKSNCAGTSGDDIIIGGNKNNVIVGMMVMMS